ncbi:MAG: HD-GYP domain-containing protein, partial [Phycisphaerae bacterium]
GQLLAGAIDLWLHAAYFTQSVRESASEAEWTRLESVLHRSNQGADTTPDANVDDLAKRPIALWLANANELHTLPPDAQPSGNESQFLWQIVKSSGTDPESARWILDSDRGAAIAVGSRQAAGHYLVLTTPLDVVVAPMQIAAHDSIPIAVLSAIWMAAIVGIISYLTLARHQDGLSRKELQSAKAAQKQTQQYVRARDAIIFALAKLADSRDPETGEHLERIVRYSGMLASAARQHPKFAREISAAEVRLIQLSSALHDIGKVGVDDRVLLKRDRLTADEMEEMKRHTTIAGECLGKIAQRAGDSGLLKMARDVALFHHERWDGGGYPLGLRETAIPLAARIVSIVDVYDALSSTRVYKAALPHHECVHMIREGAGSQFDPDLVAVWLGIEQRFAAISQSNMRMEPFPALETMTPAGTPTDTGFFPIAADTASDHKLSKERTSK